MKLKVQGHFSKAFSEVYLAFSALREYYTFEQVETSETIGNLRFLTLVKFGNYEFLQDEPKTGKGAQNTSIKTAGRIIIAFSSVGDEITHVEYYADNFDILLNELSEAQKGAKIDG